MEVTYKTLRDEIAIAVLQAVIITLEHGSRSVAIDLARGAYNWADTMLEVREEKK